MGWLVPGDPGIPRTLAPTDYKEFSPRLGIAYSPGGADGFLGQDYSADLERSSIRAGYGIYYTAIEDLTLFADRGRCALRSVLGSPAAGADAGAVPYAVGRQFSGSAFPVHLPHSGRPANKTLDYSTFLPIGGSPGYFYKNRQPYSEHYNLTLQRALSASMVMTLAYVGSEGHSLLTKMESNPGDPNLCLSLRIGGQGRHRAVRTEWRERHIHPARWQPGIRHPRRRSGTISPATATR